MKQDDEELRDDDFDLEFSDLPLEGEPALVERLALGGMALLIRSRRAASLLSVRIRTWFLTKPARQRFADGSTSDDIELEIADLPALPPTHFAGIAQAFSRLGARFTSKMRLWRAAIMLCTIILTLALVLSAVPQVRGPVFGLLGYAPTETPAASTSGTQAFTSVQLIEVPQGNGAPLDAAPAAAPQTCPSGPNLHGSSGYGRSPVWVIGFEGGPATLHFAPPHLIPDLVFPHGFAWETSVIVEVQASYQQAISLSGQNLYDGTLIYFDYNPHQGKQSSSITLNSLQTPVAPASMPNGSILSWSINLYFSSASCYSLQTHWATGSWMMYFSAGK